MFIRSFREHHIDPSEMTRHDFVQTNGDNFMVGNIFLAVPPITMFLLENVAGVPISNNLKAFVYCFNLLYCLFISLTNQAHKAAHEFKPHPVWAFLQKHHIILTRQNHNLHHNSPFDCYYTITTGWLNPFLTQIDFWRKLEFVVTGITGWQARSDDMKWNDHLNLLKTK